MRTLRRHGLVLKNGGEDIILRYFLYLYGMYIRQYKGTVIKQTPFVKDLTMGLLICFLLNILQSINL